MMMAMTAATVAANARIRTMTMTRMGGGGNFVRQGNDCTILMRMPLQTDVSDIRKFTIRQDLVSQDLSCLRCIGDGGGAVAAEWGTTVLNNFVLFRLSMCLAEGGVVGSVSADKNVNRLGV